MIQRIDDIAPSISPDVKKKCQWVANRFPEKVHRMHLLPWTHHYVVSGVEEPKKRQEFLKTAAEKNWGQSDLRKAVREYKRGLNDKPLPKDKFRVLYVDPPWKYADELIDGYGAAEDRGIVAVDRIHPVAAGGAIGAFPPVNQLTGEKCEWVSERFPPAVQTTGKNGPFSERPIALSWAYYRVVSGIDDKAERLELLHEAYDMGWTVSGPQ